MLLPTHHLDDIDLGTYSSGAADEAEALLIATHLALCPHCRRANAAFDELGAAAMLDGPASPANVSALDAMMARLDEPPPPRPPAEPAEANNDVPLPLRAYTGNLAQVPFRRVAPGIRRFDLPMSSKDRPVALVALRPNMVVPPHRHSAAERGLVLQGGFTDETGHFVRGDVSLRGPEEAEPHQQRIDKGEDCIILMVDDGPKLPTTLLGHAVNTLFGM